MTKEEAKELYLSRHPNADSPKIVESKDKFIIGCRNDDRDGYDTIDKVTKEEGFIWIMDYILLADKGEAELFNP